MPHTKPTKDTTPPVDITNKTLYKAKMFCSCETEFCVRPDEAMHIVPGDLVILNTRYGRDLVQISGIVLDKKSAEKDKVKTIIRKASDEDLEKRASLEEKTEKAFDTCRKKIEKHNLDMKLVAAHYLVDEPKILFFFTADNRIDFRELVKDLVSIFRLRIELRQIGVRDEARVLGGVAVCGRDYCCHAVTDRLVPVSIKMAKEQSLSLNSLKISGPCGRLLCCLSYEHQYYQDERKKLPLEGTRFRVDKVDFKVTELNVFTQKITVYSNEGRRLEIPADIFHYCPKSREWKVNQKITLEDLENHGESEMLSK